MSKHPLDHLKDGALSEEEQELSDSLDATDHALIARVLSFRAGVKLQSIKRNLYLSDTSIDAITTACLLHD